MLTCNNNAEINVTLDEEIMIFSASKFSGHAGNRMGWALVKDPVIAQLMQRCIHLFFFSEKKSRYIFFLIYIGDISMTTFGYSTDILTRWNLCSSTKPTLGLLPSARWPNLFLPGGPP